MTAKPPVTPTASAWDVPPANTDVRTSAAPMAVAAQRTRAVTAHAPTMPAAEMSGPATSCSERARPA